MREAHERVERLTESMLSQLEHWRMPSSVEALITLRGVDRVAAMTLVVEIGDFTCFAGTRELMRVLGLKPSEYSSGESRQQVEITKTDNRRHERHVLMETSSHE